jgi:hypothetical protein
VIRDVHSAYAIGLTPGSLEILRVGGRFSLLPEPIGLSVSLDRLSLREDPRIKIESVFGCIF